MSERNHANAVRALQGRTDDDRADIIEAQVRTIAALRATVEDQTRAIESLKAVLALKGIVV
jgi:hypothetical protein